MKFGKRDKILYSVVLVLQILAFFVYSAIVKSSDPFGAIIYPLVLSGILSCVVGFVSDFKLKGLYPLAVTLMFIVSVPIVFGAEQISSAEDFASFSVPHIVVDYFGFAAGLIGRWYGLNKRKYADR